MKDDVSGSYNVVFGYDGPFSATARGLVPAATTDGTIADDPTDTFAPGGPGTVAIKDSAGNKIDLDFTGDHLINFVVEKGAVDALVENKNLIRVDGGLAVMTAKAVDALTQSVVNP